MSKKDNLIIKFFLVPLLALYAFFAVLMLFAIGIPTEISIARGEKEEISCLNPLILYAADTDAECLEIKGEYKPGSSVSLIAKDNGNAELCFGLLGIELKKTKITVGEGKRLIPGGNTIGVLMYTKGALVVAADEKTSELKSGDIIETVNGKTIENADELTEILSKNHEPSVKLGIERDGEKMSLDIKPAVEEENGKSTARLGIWVRDSAAGVGTLTYFDVENGNMACLGHSINDADTGKMLKNGKGEIIYSKIAGIIKSEKGYPGEINGYFEPDAEVIADIYANTEAGLFAKTAEDVMPNSSLYPDGIPIGKKEEVHKGKASLLFCLDEEKGVEEFSCEIKKISRQQRIKKKSFVIKITDERLLVSVGGIVQGMSGSPIIQDGKLIGALTHVIINEPDCGYGIYIELMLEAGTVTA